MPDVVLTGLPRSGSTLVCHLLNRCADTVALHEPVPVGQLIAEHGRDALPSQIERFFSETRRSLLTQRRAPSKLVAGQVPDNSVGGSTTDADGLRGSVVARGEMEVGDKALSQDFTLAIKHNTSFAALLEHLVDRYPCYGIVRHPLAVLASWNSVRMPIREGFAPVGEQIDPALGNALRQIEDRTERQLHILEWFFERFRRWLPAERILRYEDLVRSGGRLLAVVSPAAASLAEPLASRNASTAYDPARIAELGERLSRRDGVFWEFYPRESVETMLALLPST